MSDSRKRDIVRGLFRKSDKGSPASGSPQSKNASQSSTKATTPQTSTSTSKGILNNAIATLSQKDQDTIKSHLASDTDDIVDTVKHAYQAAECQKQVCEQKQWRWKLSSGKSILLRDEANKVLAWLDRLKTIGDVVANVDPVHLGLPWAGIRVLLELEKMAVSRRLYLEIPAVAKH